MPFVKGVLARRPDDLAAAAKLLLDFGFDSVELAMPRLSYEPRWSCQCSTCAALWIASKSGDVMRIDLATGDPAHSPHQSWFPGNREARTIFHQHDGTALRAPDAAASGPSSVLLIGRDDGYLDIIPDGHKDWTSQPPSQRRASLVASFHLDSWWWQQEHAQPGHKREIAVGAGLARDEYESARYALGITALTVLSPPDRPGTLEILVATRHPWLYLLEASRGRLSLRWRIHLPGWIEWIIDPRPEDDHVTCISRGGDIVRFSREALREGRSGTWTSLPRLPTAALPFDNCVLLGTTTGLFLISEEHPGGIGVPITRSPVLCLDRVVMARPGVPICEYIVMGLEDGRLRVVDAALLRDLARGDRDASPDNPAAAAAASDLAAPPNFAIQLEHAVLAVETLQADSESPEAYVLAVLRDHTVRLYHTTDPPALRRHVTALWQQHVAALQLADGAGGVPDTEYDREFAAARGQQAPAWSGGARSDAWRYMLIEVALPRLLENALQDRDAQRDVVDLACMLADGADRRVLQRLTAAMRPLTRGAVDPILKLSRIILRAVPHRDERRWWTFIERHLRELNTLARELRDSQHRDRERLVAWTRFVRKYVLLGNTFGKKLELRELVEVCYECRKHLDALIYQARLSRHCYDLRWEIAVDGEVDGLHVVSCAEHRTLVLAVTTEGKLVFHDGITGRPLMVDHRGHLDSAVVPFPGKDRAISACAVAAAGGRLWIAVSCTDADVASPGLVVLELTRSDDRPEVVQLHAHCPRVGCAGTRARVYALQLLPGRADPADHEPPRFVAGLEDPAAPVGLLRCVDSVWTLELAEDEPAEVAGDADPHGGRGRMPTRALAVAAFDDQARRYLLVAGSDDGVVRTATFAFEDAVRDWVVRRWDQLSDAVTGVVLGRHRRTGLVAEADESLFTCYITTHRGDVVALSILDSEVPAGDPVVASFAGYDAQPIWRETHDSPVVVARLWRTPLYRADEVLVVVTEKGRLCLYNHSPATGTERVSATSNYYFRGMRFDRVTLPERTRSLAMVDNGDRFIAAGPGKRLYSAQLVYLRDSVEREDPESEQSSLDPRPELQVRGLDVARNGLPVEMWERMNHLFAHINQADMFGIDPTNDDEIEEAKLDLLDLVRLGGSALQCYGLRRRLTLRRHSGDSKEPELRKQAIERLEQLDPELPHDADKIKVILKSLCFARLYGKPPGLRNETIARSELATHYAETAATCEAVASYLSRKLGYSTPAAARLRVVAIKEALRVPMLRYLALDDPKDPRILRAVKSTLVSCLRDDDHMVRSEALRALSIMLGNVAVMADAVMDEHAESGSARDQAGRRARDRLLAALLPDGLGSLEWLIDLLIEGLRRFPSFTRRTALVSDAWYHIAALVPMFRLFPERTLALCDYLMRAGLSIEVLELCHQSLRRRGPTKIRNRIKHMYLLPALRSQDAQSAFAAWYDKTSEQHKLLQAEICLIRESPKSPEAPDDRRAWWQIDDATMSDRLCELHHRLARMWSVQRHAHIDAWMAEFDLGSTRREDPLGALSAVVSELATVAGELRDPGQPTSRALEHLDELGRRHAANVEGKWTLTARQQTVVSGIVVAWRRARTPRKGTALRDGVVLGDLVAADGSGMVFNLEAPGSWKGSHVVKVFERSSASDEAARFLAGARFQRDLSEPASERAHIVEIAHILEAEQHYPYLGYVMQRFPGSLASLLNDELHEKEDAIAWTDRAARELGLALRVVHRRNRWHGHVRPSNIFFTGEGAQRAFYLGDFELAFVHDDASEGMANIVPACLSLRCRDDDPVIRRQWHDVAALSLVLYQMLSGVVVDPHTR